MESRNTLELIAQNLWKNYDQNKKMELENWLHFLNSFFENSKIEKLFSPLNLIDNALISLGQTENLIFLLNTTRTNNWSNIEELDGFLEGIGYLKRKNKHTVIFNLSSIHLEILFFSPQNETSLKSLQVIRFPQGRIPVYFKEVIESELKTSPLKKLQQLVDMSALEADFLDNGLKFLNSSDSKTKKNFIAYLTLLLAYSGFMVFDDWFSWIDEKFQESNLITIQNYLSILREFSKQQGVGNGILSKIEAIILNSGLGRSFIDQSSFIELLRRYPYSLNEPSTFMQEVAITPLVLSSLTEGISPLSTNKKKEGKFYTSSVNAEFITYLAVFRMLCNQLAGLKTDNIIRWVFRDWNFDSFFHTGITDHLLEFPPSLRIMDPACGSGIFLLSVVRLLYKLSTTISVSKNDHIPIVELFGFDPDEIAIIVTKIRLNFFQLQKLLRDSLYGMKKGKLQIQLKFDNIYNKDLFSFNFSSKFDLILGNPPWVRHEDIGAGKTPDYKQWLITKIIELNGNSILFDRKSDLYIYFCILSFLLLEDRGVLAFLTSNAWLEVKYGRTLQNFLLNPETNVKNFDIIHRSGTRLWDQLGINSIILITEKSSSNEIVNPNGFFTESYVDFPLIPFLSLKKSIILQANHQDQYCQTERISNVLLRQTNKWGGNFLRTSSSERKAFQKLNEKGTPLSSLADIRFGIKTGANDFFYIQRIDEKQRSDRKIYIENRVGYKGLIEQEYLVPLLKSPTHIQGYIVPNSFKSSFWLFYCFDSPDELQGSDAWKYIKWGEKASVLIKQGKRSGKKIQGFSSLRSVKHREYWYSIGKYLIPTLLWTKSYHDKPGCFYNQAQSMPDQRFYGISIKHNKYLPLIFTYLNSSYIWAQMEAQGNTNMGYGVLDTNVYWLKSIKIPTEAIQEKTKIIDLMEKLIKEKKRISMFNVSKLRKDIDQFYAGYLNLMDSEVEGLQKFIIRSLRNRIGQKRT